MKHKVRVGSKIKLLNENENYNKWVNQTWIVTSITNNIEDRGYDDVLYPQYLMSCEGLPVSVYEYEVKVIEY